MDIKTLKEYIYNRNPNNSKRSMNEGAVRYDILNPLNKKVGKKNYDVVPDDFYDMGYDVFGSIDFKKKWTIISVGDVRPTADGKQLSIDMMLHPGNDREGIKYTRGNLPRMRVTIPEDQYDLADFMRVLQPSKNRNKKLQTKDYAI